LLRVSPRHGTSLGGTLVKLFGAGFLLDEILYCQFGSGNLTVLKLISNTEAECISTPQTTSNAADTFVVITNSLDVWSNVVGYSYDGIVLLFSGLIDTKYL